MNFMTIIYRRALARLKVFLSKLYVLKRYHIIVQVMASNLSSTYHDCHEEGCSQEVFSEFSELNKIQILKNIMNINVFP